MLNRETKLRGFRTINGHLSPFTIRTTLVTVKHFFRWAADHGYIVGNPAAELKIPKRPDVDPKAIDPISIEKLLEAAVQCEPWERSRNIAIIYVLRDTGGRVSGLARATVSDLDLKARRLRVAEKGDKARTLYLSKPTVTALEDWLQCRAARAKCDRLFVSCRGGRGIGRGCFYSMLRRLAKQSGVKGRFNPHSFRHAFARDTLRAGADLSRVSQLMGHSGVGVTADYYARWADSELQAIHRKVSPGRHLRPIRHGQML
jgi:site-specific recombinase XerD